MPILADTPQGRLWLGRGGGGCCRRGRGNANGNVLLNRADAMRALHIDNQHIVPRFGRQLHIQFHFSLFIRRKIWLPEELR